MNYNKSAISQRIREIRHENNLSMQDFASLIGVSGKSTINEWEKGRSIPSKKTLAKISDKLGIDANYILHGDFDQYISQLLHETIQQQKDEQLTSTFFDYLTEIKAMADYQDYEAAQTITTIQDQIRVREEVLNRAITSTIADSLNDLIEFLTNHQINFASSNSQTLKAINNFYLKKLNKLNLTKHSYIQELISNSELTKYNLTNLSDEDTVQITRIITSFQQQLKQLDN